jgi:hypothetical protein
MWIECVSQEDNGYGYTSIVNKAVAASKGEYLVFLSGDTYPADTFLEELSRALKPNRVVNGIRINLAPNGEKSSWDWRLKQLPSIENLIMSKGAEIFPLFSYPYPWELMTMNTLACSRKIWDKVEGLTPEYDGGYGKMDWSFCLKAYYSGFSLWWQTAAVGYEMDNGKPGRPDDDNNNRVFAKELEIWQNKRK